MTIYPEEYNRLLQSCSLFRERRESMDTLKADIWQAVQGIVNVEEKEARLFLQHAEARLERILFTIENDRIFDEALKIVGEIEGLAKKELEGIPQKCAER